MIVLWVLIGCSGSAPGPEPADGGPRLLCHGGGPEDDGLLTPFIEAADFGHVVTLGDVPDDDPDRDWWNDYWTSLGAASAETINGPGREFEADAVFIRGGDQARYLELWRDGPVADSLVRHWQRGGVLGGSSAGCAVLAGHVYDARVGSVAAYEALADARDPYITFAEALVPGVFPNLITDTHFTERGRLARLAVFSQREGRRGLGLDRETAVWLDGQGRGTVVGRGSLTVTDTDGTFWQLPSGYAVDVTSADPVLARPEWVDAATPVQVTWAPATLDGDEPGAMDKGSHRIVGYDGPYAWQDRELLLEPADGLLDGVIVAPRLYDDSDHFETHVGALLWALAQHPGVGLGIDVGVRVVTDAEGYQVDGGTLVVDATGATHVGVQPEGWLAVALEGARVGVERP